MTNFSFIKYNPKKYWEKRGKTYMDEQVIKQTNPLTKKGQDKEQSKLVEYLKNIEFNTVFEFGCGFGRVAKLITDNFDIDEYVGVDISLGQINNAKKLGLDKAKFYHSAILDFSTEKKFDLVLGTGVAMHIPKKQIIPTIQKLISLSKKHIINVESYDPNLTQRLARHCFNHNYKEIYEKQGLDAKIFPIEKADSIYHVQVPN